MNKKNILILGAGLMQQPAILSAKELNCNVFVVDGNPNAVSVPLADEFRCIDLKDLDSLVNYANEINTKNKLNAVFTAGTDFSTSVSYIAEKLDLPGHTYQAAKNASDKILMRSCFKKDKVNSPHFIEINENNLSKLLSNPKSFLKENGYNTDVFKYVVKPCDNMGARGCRIINCIEELEDAVKTSIDYSRTHRAIFEEFMDGREFSIDALVFNGKVTITGFAERHIFYPPYFIEMGHTMSAQLSTEDYKKLQSEFVKGVHSLGLTHGAAKGDIKLTSKGAMIGEIAARLSGGYMSGWTFPYASEVNLTKQAILLALGENPTITLDGTSVKTIKTCAERAWISIPGKVKEIYGIDKVKKINGVKDILPRSNIGDIVKFPINNVEKCGNIIVLCENYSQAVENAECGISEIVLFLEKNNSQTSEFLEQTNQTDFPPSAYKISEEKYQKLMDYCQKNVLLYENIPEILKNDLLLKDWNHRTLKQTINMFCEITNSAKKIIPNAKKFWHYTLRGGIQGSLYCYEESNSL